MSKIYSFRLDENNPREAQALEVIDAWVSKGYSLPYVLTEALMNFWSDRNHADGLDTILEQVVSLLGQQGHGRPHDKEEGNDTNLALPSSFVDSVRKAVRQGVKD